MKRKATATLKLKEPGSLILVRHGQTAMNYNKTFTGWIDTDLSETGEQEMLYVNMGYVVCLEGYLSVMLLSYSIFIGALGSPDLLVPYSMLMLIELIE